MKNQLRVFRQPGVCFVSIKDNIREEYMTLFSINHHALFIINNITSCILCYLSQFLINLDLLPNSYSEKFDVNQMIFFCSKNKIIFIRQMGVNVFKV